MATVRPASVAGTFYPADPAVLRRSVEDLLRDGSESELGIRPSLLIVPHAGYVYSGLVAASAYRLLRDVGDALRRVVLVGPAHFVAPSGLATPGVDALETPLGEVPVDTELTASAHSHPIVGPDPVAHAREHSLEVQLPFLQVVIPEFSVLALVTGNVGPDAAADVLDEVIAADDVIGIVSSDLSHYLDYDAARRRDTRTATAITELRPADLSPGDACGRTAVQAALVLAKRRGWTCRLIDLRNSGDTAGSMHQVVGYGAFAVGPKI
ncbi:MAG: AmmeMemoRadiSam system protein B [Actinomycetota bacterium]